MANRYYRPSAPRYTSQFVEEQYPFDMMMGHLQMKAGQQAAFAENMGKLQAEAALMPNGLRTEDMAPEVRSKWTNNIDSWFSQNLNKYDSPEAIAEFSRMRQMFQNDRDVLLMRKDAADSDLYKQVKMKSGASDVDPNLDPNGRPWQYSPGDAYSPFKPIIQDPDTPGRITQEFNVIKPQEITESYMYETEVNGTKMWKEGHRTVNRTPKSLFDQKLQNMIERGLENKESWAVYENAKFNQQFGRDMNAEDWRNRIQPIAESTLKSDYTDRANYLIPTDKSKEKYELGINKLNLEMADKPDEYKDWTKNLNNQLTLAAKGNPNFKIEDHAEMYNIHKQFENNNAYKGLKTWAERSRFIKNNYTKPENKIKYNIAIEPFDLDEKKKYNTLFLGQISPNEKIDVTTASSFFKGTPIYDYVNNELLQDVDKKALVKKDSSVDFLGRIEEESIGKAIKPGMVAVSIDDKQYLIQIPDFVEEERPIHDLLGMDRTVSGIGDGFVISFGFGDKGEIHDPLIHDVNNTGMDDKEIDASANNSLYYIPMRDNTDNGIRKVKVYADNPYRHYKNKNMGEYLFNDDKNDLYIGEYNIDNFVNTGELYKQLMNDAKQIIKPE